MREDQRLLSQCLCFSGLSASSSSVRMTASEFGTVRLLLKNISLRPPTTTAQTEAASLDQAALVIGRGFAHSDRRPQLKHTYCSITTPVSRSTAVSTRRVPWHFRHCMVCTLGIRQGYVQSATVAYRRDRQYAGIRHWVYPYEFVFPNSETSPGGLSTRSGPGQSPGTRVTDNHSFDQLGATLHRARTTEGKVPWPQTLPWTHRIFNPPRPAKALDCITLFRGCPVTVPQEDRS
jgi:hypothetical protein